MKNFKYVLLASAVTLSGCATTLEHRTPVDIASNSVQIKYPDTGVSEILAPPVKTFRQLRSKVKGMAQLRTAGPFTDVKGKIHEGGAYLDVLINYNSATPNPLETRQYSQARWPDGEMAQLADFGASVLDCRADMRTVRRFPFGNGAYGNGYYGYGYGGYGYGYGYGNNSRRLHNRRDHHARRDDNDVNDHTDHNYNHTDHTVHDRDRDHAGGNSNSTSGTSAVRPATAPVRPRRGRNSIDPAPQPDGPGTEPSIGPFAHPNTHTGRPHQAGQPQAHQPLARQNRTARPSRNVSNSRSSRSHTSNTGNSSSNGHNSNTQHNSSKNHRSGRHLNYYPTDPFYNPGYIDTVVRRYCARQENLRIFVPRERLDAAKYTGITLLVRPRGGREEVLSLPPSYIAGFMLAAWTPEGRNMTIPGYPLPRPAPSREIQQKTQQETLAPLPAPKQQDPKNPDPIKPGIYGDN